MSNELTIPGLIGGPSKRYQQRPVQEETIGSNIGIGLGYNVIGPTNGKQFKLQYAGESYLLPSQGKETYFDIIILRGGATPSHSWFKQGYKPDNAMGPDCQSTDGIGPDDSSPMKQATLCQDCKKHVWLKNNPENNGRDGRACSDYLRLAAFPVSQKLIEEATGVQIKEPLLFRVPAASMKALAEFLKGVRASEGQIATFSYVTRVTMRPDVPFAQYSYKVAEWLKDDTIDQLEIIAEEPLAKRIMGLSPEGRSLVRQAANMSFVDQSPGVPPNVSQVPDQVRAKLEAERQARIAAVRAAEPKPVTIDAKAETIMIEPQVPIDDELSSRPALQPVQDAPPDMAAILARFRPRPPQGG